MINQTSESVPVILSPLRVAYEARLSSGELHPDKAQAEAVAVMESFAAQLASDPRGTTLLSLLGKFFSPHNISHEAPPSGLYLYGDVGRGKSMLMDMFFATSSVTRKRRVHFHQFMLEIHDRLHKLQSDCVDDVLPHLARDIASETRLLCFDEFHVGNIADAMILGRLFVSLFEAGVIVVATSNWPPHELYKNGLQRDRFLPFIDLIKEKMIVYRLDGAIDHRYEQLRGVPSYFTPLGADATRQLQGIFLQVTGDASPDSILLPVQGRMLKIVHAARGVGFFNFEELCRVALGAADYLAIAECLHTVLIDGIPKLSDERRDEAMRFMTLIDALYENKAKLFIAAAEPLENLGPPGELRFAFQRTTSRLAEMQGETYRRHVHLG